MVRVCESSPWGKVSVGVRNFNLVIRHEKFSRACNMRWIWLILGINRKPYAESNCTIKFDLAVSTCEFEITLLPHKYSRLWEWLIECTADVAAIIIALKWNLFNTMTACNISKFFNLTVIVIVFTLFCFKHNTADPWKYPFSIICNIYLSHMIFKARGNLEAIKINEIN